MMYSDLCWPRIHFYLPLQADMNCFIFQYFVMWNAYLYLDVVLLILYVPIHTQLSKGIYIVIGFVDDTLILFHQNSYFL